MQSQQQARGKVASTKKPRRAGLAGNSKAAKTMLTRANTNLAFSPLPSSSLCTAVSPLLSLSLSHFLSLSLSLSFSLSLSPLVSPS